MIIEFLDEAEQELIQAVTWYESRLHGLGTQFRDEIVHVINRISEDPLLWKERMQ